MSKKTKNSKINEFNRRMFIKYGTGAAVVAASVGLPAPAIHAARKPVKIGFVSPQTGPLAAFGEADRFVLADANKALPKGIKIGKSTNTIFTSKLSP